MLAGWSIPRLFFTTCKKGSVHAKSVFGTWKNLGIIEAVCVGNTSPEDLVFIQLSPVLPSSFRWLIYPWFNAGVDFEKELND